MKLERGHWAVIIFNSIYILAFAVYYASIQNYEFLIYIAEMVVIALIIAYVLTRTKIDYIALWSLSVWGLLHMLGGGLRIHGKTLYSQHLIEFINHGGDYYILKMDQVIHFYGFAVAALLIFQLCWPYFQKSNKKVFPIFIAWIGSMGLGALNEVIEFAAFLTLAQTGVGDVYNTGFDLIFNLFGALFGALIVYTLYKNKKTPFNLNKK